MPQIPVPTPGLIGNLPIPGDCVARRYTSQDDGRSLPSSCNQSLRRNIIQVYGNTGSAPERKVSAVSGKVYWQFRIAESHKTSPLAGKTDGNSAAPPLWYTVRCMGDKDPKLKLGDFARVTGALKVDSYIGRDGKPASSLLVIAFDVFKYEKDLASDGDDKHGERAAPKAVAKAATKDREPLAPKVEPRQLELVSVQAPERKQEPVQEMVQEEFESDWTRLYA